MNVSNFSLSDDHICIHFGQPISENAYNFAKSKHPILPQPVARWKDGYLVLPKTSARTLQQFPDYFVRLGESIENALIETGEPPPPPPQLSEDDKLLRELRRQARI